MITITLTGTVTATNCTSEVLKAIKKALSIPNPTYHKIVRLTGSRWAAAEFYTYFKIKDDSVVFPRGFLGRFTAYLDKHSLSYTIVDNTVHTERKLWISQKPELRDYQIPIVETMIASERGGVVVAGTGSGKTILVLESIRRQKGTSLILVPNTVIQEQFVRTTKEMFGFDIAVIGGGRKELGEVVVSTWQSLSADKKLLEELKQSMAHVYCDEAHTVVSTEREKILRELNPSKLYGMTGSPRRSKDDGRTAAIFFLLGEKIYEYHATQLTPTVEVIRSGVDIPVLEYHDMIKLVVENENRNTLIGGLVTGEVMSGKKVLVLTKRVEHARILHEKFKDWEGAFHIKADDPNRDILLEELQNGDQDFVCLFGTTSLLATGLDIPSLDVVVFAADVKSDILVQQGAGRILRLFEGKTNPKIYDICDDKNPILIRQFWERKRFYERIGWEIK